MQSKPAWKFRHILKRRCRLDLELLRIICASQAWFQAWSSWASTLLAMAVWRASVTLDHWTIESLQQSRKTLWFVAEFSREIETSRVEFIHWREPTIWVSKLNLSKCRLKLFYPQHRLYWFSLTPWLELLTSTLKLNQSDEARMDEKFSCAKFGYVS